MSAKYCKTKCSSNIGEPCPIASDCWLFKWDIEKEKGNKQVPKNSPVPLEEEEQREFAEWLDRKGVLWFHIPNERKATALTLYELERQGLKKGVPDNFIAEPRGNYNGLFIELKRAKKSLSKKSLEQRQWVKALNDKGYKAVFCYGAEEAKREVLRYLDEN
jgi:ADP-heptose:LPS heptosyltransferase